MKNILLFLASSLLALLLAEGVLRFVAPPMLLGVGSDKTEKAAIYGWSAPEGTIRQMNPDTRKTFSFQSNSMGWKDVEHQIEKPPGVLRILVLGDSHTYTLVPIKNMYTRRLEKLMRKRGFDKLEVITIAMGAWGADQKLMALETEGLLYKPDIVIYQFAANDIGDNLGWGAGAKKPFRFELGATGLVKLSNPRIKPVSKVDRLKYAFISKSALGYNLFLLRNKLISDTAPKRKSTTNNPKPKDPKSAIPPGKPVVHAVPSRRMPSYEDPFNERIARHVDAYLQAKHYVLPPMSMDVLLRICRGSRMSPGGVYFHFAVGEHNPHVRKGWDLEKAILERMRETARGAGAELIIFSESGDEGERVWRDTLGLEQRDDRGRFVTRDGERYDIDLKRPLRDLTAISRELGIPLIAPRRVYHRIVYDGHPSKAGNDNMARDIVDFLLEWPPFSAMYEKRLAQAARP